MSGNPYLSVVIPVFNESQRLTDGLSTVSGYLSRQPYSWEIILVDDGSDEPVESAVRRAMKDGRIPHLSLKTTLRVIRLAKNSGKGAAVRRGVTESRGRVLVFCDIDMSVPINTMALMLKKLKQFPVVITSRRLHDSKIVVHQKFSREVSGRIFTALSNMICRTDVADVTCGFKGFTKIAALKLFSKQKINRWVFDTEVIFLARKYKMEVRQIAVAWSDKLGSKVKVGDSAGSLIDLVKIRWFDITGRYDL